MSPELSLSFSVCKMRPRILGGRPADISRLCPPSHGKDKVMTTPPSWGAGAKLTQKTPPRAQPRRCLKNVTTAAARTTTSSPPPGWLLLVKITVTINGLLNDSHPRDPSSWKKCEEPSGPQGESWPPGAGGGTPRGHRMERARRPLQRCGGRRSPQVYKTKPDAFPAGRTCSGRGQTERGRARRARSSCSGLPRVPQPGRLPPFAGARRRGAPGPAGTRADAIFLFWCPRGCAVAALGWRGPHGRGGRGTAAPEAAQEGGGGRWDVWCPGRGEKGPPHCTDAETEARRGRGWHGCQRGTGAPASDGVFRSRGPETSPANNVSGREKPGHGTPLSRSSAPRAAPGRLPAGFGLGGGAGRSRVRVTAGAAGLGLTSRRWWRWR